MNYNCKYKSNKLFNLNRHMNAIHNENQEEKNKHEEYIYLIREREFIKTNELIYKIGKLNNHV